MTFLGISRRAWKVLGISSCVAVGTSTIYVLQQSQWQLSHLGAVRFARAGQTIGRVVVDYKWTLRGLDRDAFDYQSILSATHKRNAHRLLQLACDNGGVWIKVGQHLAALEYLLPHEYTSTLSVLHSRAPESTFEDIEMVLKHDLNIQDLSEVFSSFDKEPIGAASLAQVYKATTNDGRCVAVKVQHPYVKPRSYVDIYTMEIFVKIVAKIFPEFKLSWLVDETKTNLPNELAFLHEASNTEKISDLLSHLKFLKVPAIHWDYSTDRVLVMEFCPGGQINDLAYIQKHKINTRQVCIELGQMYSEMIFTHGYVHCDPHPGNVLVNKTHDGNTQIVLLDHGLYTNLEQSLRLSYANFWLGLLRRDLDAMRVSAAEMGVGHLYGLFACMVTARSWRSITAGVAQNTMTKEEQGEIQQYVTSWLPQISDVLERVPRSMVLVFKTNDLLRGIEFTLGHQHSPYSLLQMSKYCVRTVHTQAIGRCKSLVCRLRVSLRTYWVLAGLCFYEYYLKLMDVTIFAVSKAPPPPLVITKT